ncbi:MAG: C15 family peptidase, partial [Planctomycetota bacterium]
MMLYRKNVSKILLVVFVLGATLSAPAEAQIFPEPQGSPLPDYARIIHLPEDHDSISLLAGLPDSDLPNIMLVGYWPPTNEMIRLFSPDPVQNPQGWIGGDWEERGYDIFAFFPEFPHGVGKGEGDFEVDYQDTSNDFWLITGQVNPAAIITFGRAYPDHAWTVEWRHRNLVESMWGYDYEAPYTPTPAPPDGNVPAGYKRYAALPMEEIVRAVNSAPLGIFANINDTGNSGNFLCEFVGYHASWYHDLHAGPAAPHRCIAGGHVHVGSLIDIPEAIAATEITLRTLIEYLNQPLVPNMRVLYESTGGEIAFDLNPGAAHEGRNYLLLSGMSGTSPGFKLPGGVILPLNWDGFTDLEMVLLNTSYVAGFLGTLDPQGESIAALDTQGPLPPGSAGAALYFAFALSAAPSQGWYASNAVD